MRKLSFMKTKKFVIYVKKNLVLIKMIKMHLNYTIQPEIIVIAREILEVRLIVFTV